MIVGEAGVFEVDVDGQRVFSKKELGRFPTYAEIPLAIDQKLINA